MIFQDTGEVAPGFHVLGCANMPVYLLDGSRPMLFDSGVAVRADRYVDHARQVLGSRQPDLLCLTHAHFDHCGGAGRLKEAFPGLRIAASAQAAEILARPRAVEVIRALNDELQMGVDADGPGFRPFEIDIILHDGDRIDLGGGRALEVLATPGHTRDFLSFYEPERRLLVASEAGGCRHPSGALMVEFVYDYDAYVASLRRLMALDADVLCQGHDSVYTGGDGADFLARSLTATERYRAAVEAFLAEEQGDLDRVVQRIREEQWVPLPSPKQTESAFLLNTTARVRHLASRLGRCVGGTLGPG